MEECVSLVCETLGVGVCDEVSVENISALYQKVFHTDGELRDVQRAITQVSTQNGGLPCSGRWILQVLLEMEKEREKREKLYWELQMLKSGRSGVYDGVNTQPLSVKSSCKHDKKRNPKACGLLGMARRLHVRLDIDGVWSSLPSLSVSQVNSRRLGLIKPTKSDILLLLQYKYDIIKERLYREMLQEEHGVGWWEMMEPSEQTDCVCDLEQRAEKAFNLNDVLCMCDLPGILHSYSSEPLTVMVDDDRSSDEVVLHSCTSEDKVRDKEWTSSRQGRSWTSAVLLSELRSHCEEERRCLTQLLYREERLVLTEIYLSVCVSVRRAERETHSHTALLTSRQHWDNWPNMRRLDVEELVKFWLQEKQDPSQVRSECRTSHWVQQAVLQYMVLCQEHERRTLVEILHSVSQEELQDERHTLTPDYKAAGTTGWTLRRGCVSILKQIKSSLQCSSTHSSVPWADCAVHLLTQLTHTHDQEAQTVIHTLLVMDAAALKVLLHNYELELCSPKLHNLHNLLQTSSSENSQINISVTDSVRTEQRQNTTSVSGEQDTCTGCGVLLVPEDTPYLEILCVREQGEQERRDRKEEEEERRVRREEEEEEEEERGNRREEEEEERRDRREEEEEEERREGEKERKDRREEDEEERRDRREEEEERREGEKERKDRREEDEEERRDRREEVEEERRDRREGEEEERRDRREGEEERRDRREEEEEERRDRREEEEEERRDRREEEEEERRDRREEVEEERRDRREGEEEEKRDRREGEEERIDRRKEIEEGRRDGSKGEEEKKKRVRREGEGERRDRSEGAKEEEGKDRRKGEEKERRDRREGEERRLRREGEEENVDVVEKQASLITLAWSKPTGNNTQEVTSALPVTQTTEALSTDSHTVDHTHHHEHTLTAQTHTLVEPLQHQSTSSMDVQNESSSEEHGTAAAQERNTPDTGNTHTQDMMCDTVCEEQQLQREATMRSLVDIQRKAEKRWQRDRDRQILRVQERLSIIQNRKSDEELRHQDTFRHLTSSLQQEDEQQQKVLVREKLQQLWRERSYVLQSRRERNTTGFKELLTPSAQCLTNTEDVLNTLTHTHLNTTHTHLNTTHTP